MFELVGYHVDASRVYYGHGNRVCPQIPFPTEPLVGKGFCGHTPIMEDILGDVPKDKGLSFPNGDRGMLPSCDQHEKGETALCWIFSGHKRIAMLGKNLSAKMLLWMNPSVKMLIWKNP